jgi:hypothetical protein
MRLANLDDLFIKRATQLASKDQGVFDLVELWVETKEDPEERELIVKAIQDLIHENSLLPPLDKLGRPITVGCYIAYGHALGRCAGIRIGKVLAIKKNPEADNYPGEGWKFTVWGVDDDWNRLQLNSRKGTLFFTTRIFVLDEVPAEYKTLLENV